VRMDIQTAVQISSLSPEYPIGILDLLTEGEPAPLEPHVWPQAPAAIESAVTTGDQWLVALRRKVRDARQKQHVDNRAYERRVANRLAMSRDLRTSRRLDIAIAVLVVALLIALACMIPVWLS
jgi:hypothetical protein